MTPVTENCSQASFTINSFYGQKNETILSRKVPFYLRYSQGCNKKVHLKEVQNISQLEQDSEETNLENKCSKPVPCKRPCYYQEPKEKKSHVLSSKSFFHAKKTIENIGNVMPQTPSPVSHSTTVSTKCSEERKFFKNRNTSASNVSEGSTVTGTAVIKQGFNLSFVPRRLSASFDKKIKRQKKRHLPRKKRHYNKNNNTVVEPLSPLSRVFPELDLDSLSSIASTTSATELAVASQQMENTASYQTCDVNNENNSWTRLNPAKNSNDILTSTCNSTCVSTLPDSAREYGLKKKPF